MKIAIKITMFLTLSKGGYARTFEAVDYPGMTGVVKRTTRKDPEQKELYVGDEIFSGDKMVERAVEAWKRKEEEKKALYINEGERP